MLDLIVQNAQSMTSKSCGSISPISGHFIETFFYQRENLWVKYLNSISDKTSKNADFKNNNNNDSISWYPVYDANVVTLIIFVNRVISDIYTIVA